LGGAVEKGLGRCDYEDEIAYTSVLEGFAPVHLAYFLFRRLILYVIAFIAFS
jgi:hypothetical protein